MHRPEISSTNASDGLQMSAENAAGDTPLYTYPRERFLAVVSGSISLVEYGEEVAAHVASQLPQPAEAPNYA